ncbi:MAG TPA: DUF6285 domain-containing protein [Longimicrobiaceae bacterium]|nr:DUF6285 domain-containing protein [Longimicrobiaceae bacterium]
MQDRPTAPELAQAVLEFLQGEILPALQDPRLRFRTLVAANALGILARELEGEEELLLGEHARLARLLKVVPESPATLQALRARVLELNVELVRRIRRGQAPPGSFEHVRQTTREKLVIASPRTLEDR